MGKLILVIDDSTAIRGAVDLTLKTAGFDIVEAGDGIEGLGKLKENDVSLIVCDVNMPNMDGIEFLEKIKKDEEYSSYRFTPIIMLTTEAGAEMKEKGKKLGARAWLVKPFTPEQLIDSVSKLVM